LALSDTERPRANASSVNEKETPCVAAVVASQSQRVDSLAALQGLRGICNQLRQAWRQAVLGCKLRAVALDARRCVMIEHLTHDERERTSTFYARNHEKMMEARCDIGRTKCQPHTARIRGKKRQCDESSLVAVWQEARWPKRPGCDDWTGGCRRWGSY
jgi:hypothetical protein